MFEYLNSSKRSLQEQLVLFGCGLPCFFLVPFSLYRIFVGDYVIAAIDCMISLGLALIFVQTWQGRKNQIINAFSVMCFMAGVAAVMQMKGLSMVFWAFPTLIFTYFVLTSIHALFANILFVASITLVYLDALSKSQVLSIYPSLLLVGLFGFVFSVCSESQNKKLLQRVSTDTLTGVKNRRSFDEKVDDIIDNHKRFAKPVSMLLLDLDYFKKINDTHGHNVGDRILADFARSVKSIIRTTDYIYRFGGEEFVVIANNSSIQNSGIFAEIIREFILQSNTLSQYNVTVSIGVSEICDDDDADSWFRRADRALYESKELGRNRVTLANLDKNNLVEFLAINPTKTFKSVPARVRNSDQNTSEQKSPTYSQEETKNENLSLS